MVLSTFRAILWGKTWTKVFTYIYIKRLHWLSFYYTHLHLVVVLSPFSFIITSTVFGRPCRSQIMAVTSLKWVQRFTAIKHDMQHIQHIPQPHSPHPSSPLPSPPTTSHQSPTIDWSPHRLPQGSHHQHHLPPASRQARWEENWGNFAHGKRRGQMEFPPRLLKACAAELGEPIQRVFNLSLSLL